MEISSVNQQQTASVQQALSIMTLDQSMNLNGATMSKLMKGMKEMNQEIQQVRFRTMPGPGQPGCLC